VHKLFAYADIYYKVLKRSPNLFSIYMKINFAIAFKGVGLLIRIKFDALPLGMYNPAIPFSIT